MYPLYDGRKNSHNRTKKLEPTARTRFLWTVPQCSQKDDEDDDDETVHSWGRVRASLKKTFKPFSPTEPLMWFIFQA